jgi:hypothetical protein
MPIDVPEEEEGLLVKRMRAWFIKWFGRSWRTTFAAWGVAVFGFFWPAVNDLVVNGVTDWRAYAHAIAGAFLVRLGRVAADIKWVDAKVDKVEAKVEVPPAAPASSEAKE